MRRGGLLTRKGAHVRMLAIAVIAIIGSTIPVHADTYTYRYLVLPVADAGDIPAPGARIAPFSMVDIRPEGTEVTVTIADDVKPDGRFAFKICQPNQPGPGDWVCGHGHDDVSTGDICYDGPTTLGGLVPGNPVEIALWFAPSPCPDAATTGILTVVG